MLSAECRTTGETKRKRNGGQDRQDGGRVPAVLAGRAQAARKGAPNILVVLFDDVGFSDFGCYGSPIATPTIDAIAARGLRYTGFHTTAMCSTTRAALLTGRNHHSVGVGCLANFDSGLSRLSRQDRASEAGTLAEMLRPHGYRNYMLGKWHVTPLTESGATGPFDGWPLGRGFDRFYGFMDAETDQYAPELVRDNTPVDPPGTFATGYHLTADLVDQAIRYLADHVADDAETPWLTWLALGACHAPHQAPVDLIRKYDALFADGWDAEREQRLARQKEMGIVPQDTRLPPRNDGVKPWAEPAGRRAAALHAPAGGLCRDARPCRPAPRAADRASSRQSGQLDDTLVIVMSDNGASQEGGPLGMVNAMGPYNLRREPIEEKIARIDDIGGPDTHSNFPLGWAMAANTPLRRYKQNTHGGGIRDPLVISWPKGIAARGELRHQFCHASDLAPTLLDVVGVDAARRRSTASSRCRSRARASPRASRTPKAPSKASAAIFRDVRPSRPVAGRLEGRGVPSAGHDFDQDKWELFHLDRDFNETDDLAATRARAAEGDDRRMVAPGRGAQGAAARRPLRAALRRQCQALPRCRARASCSMPAWATCRPTWRPTCAAAPTRSRPMRAIDGAATEGVLIAHGDMTCGYSLYIKDNRLTYDMNIGGQHHIAVSDRPVPAGNRRLGVRMRRKRRPQHRDPADRRRAGRRLREPARLHQLHLLVGPRYRPRPRQPGLALRGAVRLHRQAAQGHRDRWTTTRRSTPKAAADAVLARE